jgi:hypothetical protein
MSSLYGRVLFFVILVSFVVSANTALGSTQFDFDLNGQHFQFFPILPALSQVEVLIMYTPHHQCKLTYYDWMKREWDWAVELALGQNLSLKTSNGHVFLVECGEGMNG